MFPWLLIQLSSGVLVVIPGDDVTTENAMFARAVTGVGAAFGRAVSSEPAAVSRVVTTKRTER